MEKKTFDFKVQKAESNIFEGYASTFDGLDLQGDTISKGAFSTNLEKKDLLVLFQHNADHAIGKILEMKEDDHGLFVRGKISETTLGKDIMTLLKDQVLQKMSIGFKILDQEPTEDGRLLKSIDLIEISIVSFPANPDAIITGAKSFKTKNVRISGDRINEFLSLQDSFFEENPVEKDLIVTDTISTKEQQEFYDTMKEWFELKIEDVV